MTYDSTCIIHQLHPDHGAVIEILVAIDDECVSHTHAIDESHRIVTETPCGTCDGILLNSDTFQSFRVGYNDFGYATHLSQLTHETIEKH
jgi:hypothetical protein